MKRLSALKKATVQPSWGQMASKAAKTPADGWTTTAGSPVFGSLKMADPPTATALATATVLPGGVDLVGPGFAVVGGGVTGAGVMESAESVACPTSRPRPAASPA